MGLQVITRDRAVPSAGEDFCPVFRDLQGGVQVEMGGIAGHAGAGVVARGHRGALQGDVVFAGRFG